MPGSPRELELFGSRATSDPIFAPDRTNPYPVNRTDHLDTIAAEVGRRYPAGNVRLIAFSLGVVPALQVAARLGPLVTAIDLVSAAAPLETGDYPNMAGRAVFGVAGRWPRLFTLLVTMQSFAARYASGWLYNRLFASARGADRDLALIPDFRATVTKVLADCLGGPANGYREEVTAYVARWADLLSDVEQLVTLWHGTADNWAPIEMASALQAALPNVAQVNTLSGLSHYSTLQVALATRLRPA